MHSQQRASSTARLPASSNSQQHSDDVGAGAGKACRKGLRCTRQDCRFQHPPQWNPQAPPAGNQQPSNAAGGAGTLQPPQPNVRGASAAAGNAQPPNVRGASAAAGNLQPSNPRGAPAACRHGMSRTRTDCRFQHPPEWNPHRPPPVASCPPPPRSYATSRPSAPPRSSAPPPPPPLPALAQPWSARGPKMCRYGMNCTRYNCRFQHPAEWDSDQAADLEPPGREPPAQRQCRHGSACRNPACTFGHPPDWDPPTENQALCVVKSQPLGKSLYNKMTGDGWYGDKLEKLNNKVGATVTYLEFECRLRARVPYDQAPHAQRCMNRAIDESRPHLSWESRELNIVGTTRVVVGRGGQVLCVLTGRDTRAIDALLAPAAKGHVRGEDLQATKEIMSRFMLPNADGSPSPRPSVQPMNGKMRITFHRPEDAQSALDAYPQGPWARLEPFIQPPREGTVVQVLELKIVYPLAARPKRERQVVIHQQLVPFGVRMQDIEISRGDSKTGTRTATVYMRSKSNADAALLHLQTYACRSNELASRPGEVDVQLHSGFRVSVARKQCRALEGKLTSLQSRHPNICFNIRAPQYNCDFAVIQLTKHQEDRPADQDDLLRACKDVEAALQGVVIQLDHEIMQALPTKRFEEVLESVEEEFDGQVAIFAEMESSRVRLFGSTSLEDSSIFTANPLKEAYNTIIQLVESHCNNKQPSFVKIPPNTRNWLLRGLPNTMPALRDALQKQLGNAAGVKVDRVDEEKGGTAVVKLVGLPAANLEAIELLEDLQSATGSSCYSEIVDSMRPAPDTVCAICRGEIEPAERHLMEPCLHSYHKECAVRCVKSALEERKLPVMCQHPVCVPQPVCLGDIKLLLGDNSEFEKLCTALMLHVNQNPALGGSPTVNCKQHPDGRNPDQAGAAESLQREPAAQRQCKNGSACKDPACTYGHPPDWMPPTSHTLPDLSLGNILGDIFNQPSSGSSRPQPGPASSLVTGDRGGAAASATAAAAQAQLSDPFASPPMPVPQPPSCAICFSEPIEYGFLHGGSIHSCSCRRCAERIGEGGSCPICRQEVEQVLRVYFPLPYEVELQPHSSSGTHTPPLGCAAPSTESALSPVMPHKIPPAAAESQLHRSGMTDSEVIRMRSPSKTAAPRLWEEEPSNPQQQQGSMAPQSQHFREGKELDGGNLAAKEAEALAFLQQLRRERFFLDADSKESKHDEAFQGAAYADLFGKALKELAHNPYASDNRFLMELIQNADDCQYNTSTPALCFELYADRIIVKSNEVGFDKHNVAGLCHMFKSSKLTSKSSKQKLTGEKKIGFKSVFVITDTPTIHSNGFHFKFDVNMDPVFGFMAPTPVAPLPIDKHNVQETATCFELPLKPAFQGKSSGTALRAKFSSISSLLLLFLRTLRRISVWDAVAQKEMTLQKWQDSANPNCVRLHTFSGSSQLNTKWLLVEKVLHFDPPIRRREIGSESTSISLAYYLPTGENNNEQPEVQHVYAYLPTRKYGFKFAVQGDWEVAPSREEIFDNNKFNLELRKAIPDLGMEALEHFMRLPSPRPDRPYFWIDWWLRCLPLEGEVDDLFALPARQLRMSAMSTPCIPDHLGVLMRPTHVSVCADPNMSALMTEPRASKLLDVHLVHPDVSCMYASDSRVRQQLHVGRFATSELLLCARKVCETGILQELGMPWLVGLLVCAFQNLAELPDQERARMLADLRRLPILPLMDGSTVSMCSSSSSSSSSSSNSKDRSSFGQPAHAEANSAAGHAQQQQQAPRPVFFPLQCSVRAMKAKAAGFGVAAVPAEEAGIVTGVDSIKCTSAEKLLLDVNLDWIQMGLQQLHPDLFQVEHSKAQKLWNGLADLGVRDLSHADVLQLHVLPLFRRYKERLTFAQHKQQQQQQRQQQQQQEEQQQPQQEACSSHGVQASATENEACQLTAALTYVVASGLMQDPTVCARVRECAVVLTNRGLCHALTSSCTVYLPPELGNTILNLPACFPCHNFVSSLDYHNSSVTAHQISSEQWGAAFAQLGAHCWLPLQRSKVDTRADKSSGVGTAAHKGGSRDPGLPATYQPHLSSSLQPLFGRELEARAMLGLLHQGLPVMLVGNSGVGKSVLAHHALSLIEAPAVVIDMAATSTAEDLLAQVCRSFSVSTREQGHPEASPLSRNHLMDHLMRRLHRMCCDAPTPIAIFLDNCEAALAQPSARLGLKELASELQTAQLPLKLVLAARHLQGQHTPTLPGVVELRVSSLDIQTARTLASSVYSPAGLSLSPTDGERIAIACEGNPLKICVIASAIGSGRIDLEGGLVAAKRSSCFVDLLGGALSEYLNDLVQLSFFSDTFSTPDASILTGLGERKASWMLRELNARQLVQRQGLHSWRVPTALKVAARDAIGWECVEHCQARFVAFMTLQMMEIANLPAEFHFAWLTRHHQDVCTAVEAVDHSKLARAELAKHTLAHEVGLLNDMFECVGLDHLLTQAWHALRLESFTSALAATSIQWPGFSRKDVQDGDLPSAPFPLSADADSPTPVLYQPGDLNVHMAGRQAEVQNLQGLLVQGHTVMITGCSGMGKSTLIQHVLEQTQACSVTVILATATSASDVLTTICQAFGVNTAVEADFASPEAEVLKGDSKEAQIAGFLAWLDGLSKGPDASQIHDALIERLLTRLQDLCKGSRLKAVVLNSCEVPLADQGGFQMLQHFLGKLQASGLPLKLLLQYSKEPGRAAVVLPGVEVLDLEPLDSQSAEGLAAGVLSLKGMRSCLEDQQHTLAACGGHPLKIKMVAAQVAAGKTTFQDLLQTAQSPSCFAQLLGSIPSDLQQNLLLLSCFGSSFSTQEAGMLFKADKDKASQLLKVLRDHQLLDTSHVGAHGDAWCIHPIVRQACQEVAGQDRTEAAWVEFVDCMAGQLVQHRVVPARVSMRWLSWRHADLPSALAALMQHEDARDAFFKRVLFAGFSRLKSLLSEAGLELVQGVRGDA